MEKEIAKRVKPAKVEKHKNKIKPGSYVIPSARVVKFIRSCISGFDSLDKLKELRAKISEATLSLVKILVEKNPEYKLAREKIEKCSKTDKKAQSQLRSEERAMRMKILSESDQESPEAKLGATINELREKINEIRIAKTGVDFEKAVGLFVNAYVKEILGVITAAPAVHAELFEADKFQTPFARLYTSLTAFGRFKDVQAEHVKVKADKATAEKKEVVSKKSSTKKQFLSNFIKDAYKINHKTNEKMRFPGFLWKYLSDLVRETMERISKLLFVMVVNSKTKTLSHKTFLIAIASLMVERKCEPREIIERLRTMFQELNKEKKKSKEPEAK